MTTQSDIRLRDLSAIFWNQILLMATILALSISAASVFLLIVKPTYRAHAYLLPPSDAEITLLDARGVPISSMQLPRLEFSDVASEDAYRMFLINIQSRDLRREFFNREGLYEHYISYLDLDPSSWSEDAVFSEHFNNDLTFDQGQSAPFHQISLEFDDPAMATDLLNALVRYTNRTTISQLFAPVQRQLAGHIESLKDEIAHMRKSALRKIDDQIEKKTEAAEIARRLGIQEPTLEFKRATQGGVSVTTSRVPEYMRGEQALRAEIDALVSRRGKDAFITDLHEKQQELERLSATNIDLSSASAVRLDQAAYQPRSQNFPRPVVTIALSIVAGSMLAVFCALLRHIWSQEPRQSPSV